ncbi:MAG: phosphodiester glycosidase family protein [Anaerolineae bacterium]|nr:phosphodiester glycosidase family protein [Anaerolineae bacterium]
MAKSARPLAVLGWLAVLTVAGCNLVTAQSGAASIVLMPTPAPPASDLNGEWQAVAPGVAWRELVLDAGEGWEVQVTAVRFDPGAVTFRVHYAPGEAHTIYEWARQTGAVFLINTSFFTPERVANGLVVADGQRYGQSYAGYGGMFQVSSGRVRVRSLRQEPYHIGEPLDQAVQAFPMLVDPGGVPAYDEFDDLRARRSIVGIDRQGRVIFIVLPVLGLTLYETSQWLAASDFDLDVALNLDGGGSTALFFEFGEVCKVRVGFDRVPAVIAAYPH